MDANARFRVGALLVAVAMVAAGCDLFGVRSPASPSTRTLPPPVTTLPPVATLPPVPTLPSIAPPVVLPPTTPPAVPAGSVSSYIPPEIAATCEPLLVAYAGSIDGVQCRPAGATVAYYVRFADRASMDAAFDAEWTSDAVDALDGGLCDNGTSGVGSVTFDDGSAGRYLCHPSSTINAYWLWWTHHATNILGYAAVDGTDFQPLYDWWQNAGPVTNPVGQVPPQTPGAPPDLPTADPNQPPPVEPPPVEPPTAPPPQTEGQPCVAGAPLSVNDLLGTWSWDRTLVVEAGDEYITGVYGTWTFGADGRWEGERSIDYGGGGFDAVRHGPGSWTFDGYALTVTFGDGAGPETFDIVRIGPSPDGTGSALYLDQVGEGTDCTTWALLR